MPAWLYTVRERLTPTSQRCVGNQVFDWQGYLEFSGFRDLREVITLDSILCPDVITELTEEDWNHNVHEDYRLWLFRDAEWLKMREPRLQDGQQILAVLERPTGEADEHEHLPHGFLHCGYDIMDADNSISALTNCGPIPSAFSAAEVNEYGLIPDWHSAERIRDRLRELEPDDPHLGACEVWSIARLFP